MAKTDVRTGARAERTQNPTLGASYSRLTLLTCSISIVWRDQKFSGRGDGAPVEGRAHPAHPGGSPQTRAQEIADAERGHGPDGPARSARQPTRTIAWRPRRPTQHSHQRSVPYLFRVARE